jgi:hypothetical protein
MTHFFGEISWLIDTAVVELKRMKTVVRVVVRMVVRMLRNSVVGDTNLMERGTDHLEHFARPDSTDHVRSTAPD